MTRRRSDWHAGFTLIEALVAFAIVAAATIVLQRGLVQSRLGLAAAAEREAAEWVARDLLATPLTLADMQNGGRTGMSGGRRFAISLVPLDLPTVDAVAPAPDRKDQPPATQPGPALRWVPMRERITVETGSARAVSIETVKLGPVEQAADRK